MVDKTMFGRLPEYASEYTWQQNKTITFDTVYEHRQYEVMSCFYSRLYEEGEPGFRFYEYYDLRKEDKFNEYVRQADAAMISSHTGPGLNYWENMVLYQNDELALLAEQSGWSLIMTRSGKFGWVLSDLLTATEPKI